MAVIVHLNSPAEADLVPLENRSSRVGRQQAVIEALQSRAALTQKPLLDELRAAQTRGEAGRVVSLWINNSILVEAGSGLLAALAQRPDVAQIVPDYDPANPIVPVGDRTRT